MIELKNLNFTYKSGNLLVPALKDVNLKISSGDIFTVEGPSGSGKSTLLNILGLIEAPPSGQVFYENKDVSRLAESEKNKIRRYDIGFIFQSFYLFPVLTAYENLEYFLVKQKIERSEREKIIINALKLFKISHLAHKKPVDLSGGQRQRVAIARAFCKKPKLLIADEPTASLDHENAETVISELKTINENLGTTVIVASHDELVLSKFKRRIKLVDGTLMGGV